MASPERELEIAGAAISEMLRKHKAQGHNMAAMVDAMLANAERGMELLIGGERMADLHRNKADAAELRTTRPALNLAKPTADDMRIWAAEALDDGMPPAFDRNAGYLAALMHAAWSLVSRGGANDVLAILADLPVQIKAAIAERAVRTGDPRDLN